MTTQQENAIVKHGENLNAIFNTGLDPVQLCKKLRMFEGKAHRLCVHECNTGEDMDVQLSKILTAVKKVLFPKSFDSNPELFKAVFINGDPRGYALKIKSEYVEKHSLKIDTDWGGYGLIAPEITKEGKSI